MRRPRTDIRPPFGTLNANSATMQPLSNSDTDATNRHSTISQTIQQPLSNPDNHREPQPHPQPSFNRHATASQPRTNHNRPSCRITERFRHNHPTSTILESTTSICPASARPSTALVVASFPTPPATRRRLRSCRQCCRERRRRQEAQTPCKMGLSWGLSLKFRQAQVSKTYAC